jgi:hypothetical protein
VFLSLASLDRLDQLTIMKIPIFIDREKFAILEGGFRFCRSKTAKALMHLFFAEIRNIRRHLPEKFDVPKSPFNSWSLAIDQIRPGTDYIL